MSTEEEKGDSTEESLYAEVGAAVISCQRVEKLMAFCLTHLFPDESILSAEMLGRVDEQNRKRWLGKLDCELRKRVEYRGVLGEEISSFIKHRNDLVHDLTRATAHGFTPEGIAEMKAFAFNTGSEAIVLGGIFIGLIQAWKKQQGLPISDNSEIGTFIREFLGPSFDKIDFPKPGWKLDKP
jgi:hypothetical protein